MIGYPAVTHINPLVHVFIHVGYPLFYTGYIDYGAVSIIWAFSGQKVSNLLW